MTFSEYQEGVRATWNKDISKEEQVTNAILGIVGEMGELAEMIKKSRYHKIAYAETDEQKELGDILYYITALIDIAGFNLEEIAKRNHAKLKSRYPSGFVTGGGNREVRGL